MTLVTQTEVGRHNADLAASAGRIIQGGSWKRQRVVTVIPSDQKIDARVYLSHVNLIYPPNQPSYRVLALGQEVGEAYSTAIETVVNHPDLGKWEYVLTLEADNMPPPDGLLKLLRRMEQRPELACIGGLYWTKGYGGVPQIWGDPKDPIPNHRPIPPVQGEVVECCGTGMGFNLWRMAMFKDPALRRPWFKTQAGPGGVGTQDLYLWEDARKHGYRCGVDCDVLVGHWDDREQIAW